MKKNDILLKKLKSLAIIFTTSLLLGLVNYFFIKSNLLTQTLILVIIFYTIYTCILLSIITIRIKSNTKK